MIFILLFIILIITLVIFAPLVAIWAISMFGVVPVYDFQHWFAMFIILAMLNGIKFRFSSINK